MKALALRDGIVFVGGEFDDAGGDSARGIARWDGERWTPLGHGLRRLLPGFPYGSPPDTVRGIVEAIALYGDHVCAGGNFFVPEAAEDYGAAVHNLSCWDGERWTPLGEVPYADSAGRYASPVMALQTSPDGRFLYAPALEYGHGALAVRRWDGHAWTEVASLPGLYHGASLAALVLAGRYLYAGGSFVKPGDPLGRNIARLDLETGQDKAVGDPQALGVDGFVTTLLADGRGGVYVGGQMLVPGESSTMGLAHFDGTRWRTLGGTLYGPLSAIAADGVDIYVGGSFGFMEGTQEPVANFARWNAATETWTPFVVGEGEYFEGPGDGVSTILVHDGKVYVGGRFETAGGVPARNVAVLDPATGAWSALAYSRLAFARNWILKRGFLDGSTGLIVSMLNSHYVFLKYAKLWPDGPPPSGEPRP